ncbi:MAG: transposase [Mogibacterium sp.]|nr:transposase [Mogibacterium sp.]
MAKLKACKDRYEIKVAAYCLMNNHAHLLIKAESLDTLSRMMRSLGVSYASYYNIKYSHEGHVFQDRFLSMTVCDEKYLCGCLRYIHNNPVSAGICPREEYRWSSYRDYLEDRGIADRDDIIAYFGNLEAFIKFSQSDDSEDYMDCELPSDKMRMAQKIINEELGHEFNNGFIVKKYAKEDRDKVLRRLRKEGYSIKQIELLTGVSKRIIQRA